MLLKYDVMVRNKGLDDDSHELIIPRDLVTRSIILCLHGVKRFGFQRIHRGSKGL